MFDRLLEAYSVFSIYFNDSSLVFAATVGLSIGVLALTLMFLLNNTFSKSRRKVRAAVHERSYNPGAAAASRSASKLDSAVAPLKPVILPSSEKESSAVRKRLVSAGYRNSSAMTVFYVLRLMLALLLGIVTLFATTFFPQLSSTHIIIWTGLATLLGLLLPSYLLDKQVAARKLRIIHAFPEMLDMLVACSEAGLGLNAALQRVCKEIDLTFPDLAEELDLVNAEMLAGVDRIQALKGFSTRTDISDISGFVSMLTQSVRFGTGVAETLRIYAEEFRDKRMQRAEEAAAKIGTKLLFPLVFCMFPSFFVVAVGPAVIAIITAFRGMAA